jgi:zinc protease
MNFNGSKHFESGELVSICESIGARFGADANAYTSFDETGTCSTCPADKDSLTIKGLWAMGDYAGRARLSDKEIERSGRGAGRVAPRTRGAGPDARQALPGALRRLRVCRAAPIASRTSSSIAAPGLIRDFYADWYRPERMAIIAGGRSRPDSMLAKIQAEFGDIPKSESLAPLPVHDIPPHDDLKVSVATDAEARFTWPPSTSRSRARSRGRWAITAIN